jgi:hypothetical protein
VPDQNVTVNAAVEEFIDRRLIQTEFAGAFYFCLRFRPVFIYGGLYRAVIAGQHFFREVRLTERHRFLELRHGLQPNSHIRVKECSIRIAIYEKGFFRQYHSLFHIIGTGRPFRRNAQSVRQTDQVFRRTLMCHRR